MTKITELAIQRLPIPEQGQKAYWDDSLPGFGVRVSQGGRRSFVVMFGGAKNRKLKTIGRYPDTKLADARSKAKRLLANQSPYKTSIAYSDAVESFLEECKTKNRPKTVKEYTRYLNAFETSAKMEDVTRKDIRKHLEQYGAYPSTQAHALTAFKVFFNWAIRNETIDRHPLMGERSQTLQSRTRVLTTEELKALWQYEFRPFSDILKLLILTGQRRSEIASIHSGWIVEDTITLPSQVTKNRRQHTFPFHHLSAQYLLGDGMLFGNTKGTAFSGWSKAKGRLDKHVNIPEWTLHDLRRTHSTIAASLGIPSHIEERLLNHASGATTSGVAGIYNQYDYLEEARCAVVTFEEHISIITGT